MNKTLFLLFSFCIFASVILADDYKDLEPMKLQATDMTPKLTQKQTVTFETESTPEQDYRIEPLVNSSATKIKPHYTFLGDQTWAGIPVFIAGIIAKSEKKSFRQDYNNTHYNTRLLTSFHTEIDNYTQFVPMLAATALNLSGYEGRSDFWRYLASGVMSYGIMAAIVNPIKYSAKEMRPDGSTANSWPSGHTATAFVSATILHKEYGLTRSPWYSIAGYGIATAPGVMRVLNNRHWISDVLSGAGIGILSTELAYGLSDIIFKDTHLKRGPLVQDNDIINNPSYFSVYMGMGFGSKTMDFKTTDMDYGTGPNIDLKFGTSTVVGVEGAYFFNKYVGIGGRLSVKSSPIKGWSDFLSYGRERMEKIAEEYKTTDEIKNIITDKEFTIQSDHLTEFTADAGLYFNIPLTSRLALGTKILAGHSTMQSLEIDANVKGKVYKTDYDVTIKNGEITSFHLNSVTETGETYDTSWDYVTLTGNNTATYGTGISLTYAYKDNYSWKLFCDYDYAHKTYTLTFDPDKWSSYAIPNDGLLERIFNIGNTPEVYSIKKHMHTWTVGAAFTISF